MDFFISMATKKMEKREFRNEDLKLYNQIYKEDPEVYINDIEVITFVIKYICYAAENNIKKGKIQEGNSNLSRARGILLEQMQKNTNHREKLDTLLDKVLDLIEYNNILTKSDKNSQKGNLFGKSTERMVQYKSR